MHTEQEQQLIDEICKDKDETIADLLEALELAGAEIRFALAGGNYTTKNIEVIREAIRKAKS